MDIYNERDLRDCMDKLKEQALTEKIKSTTNKSRIRWMRHTSAKNRRKVCQCAIERFRKDKKEEELIWNLKRY